jgi:SPP1 gp7 family putative phage head morphogenesis protein
MNEFEKNLLEVVKEMYDLSDNEFNQVLLQYKNSRDNILQFLSQLFMEYGHDGQLDYSEISSNGAFRNFERQVEVELQSIGTLEIAVLTGILGVVAYQAYNKTAFQMEQSLEVGIDFKRMNQNIIDEFVNFDWSGLSYSQRIWKNQQSLRDVLKTTLVRSIQDGESIDKISRKFKKEFNSKAYQSERLVRTETARVIEQSKEKLYKDIGQDKVQWLATLEENTCSECASLDGKVFNLDDTKRPKIPRHPNCRCDYSPYIPSVPKYRKDNEIKEYIPYKTYEEWSKANNV